MKAKVKGGATLMDRGALRALETRQKAGKGEIVQATHIMPGVLTTKSANRRKLICNNIICEQTDANHAENHAGLAGLGTELNLPIFHFTC